MNTVKKNYIYNLSHQFIIVLLGIILMPYIARILGSEGIGTYSYTYNIVSYFSLFSILGINNYGNRLIGSTRDNKEEMSRQFISLYILQFLTSFLIIVIYLLYVFLIVKYDKFISLIQIFYLLGTLLNVNWFFCGIEKFKLITIVDLIIKVLNFFSILFLVKEPSHLNRYIFIMSLSYFISHSIFFVILKKEIKLVKINIDDIKKHFKPCLVLFIPVIAVSVYKTMNKILLGSISGTLELGYYEQADKIINIPLSIINALAIIMLPKISNLLSNDEHLKVKNYIYNSMQFIMFLMFPIVFGLITISKDFILVFLGADFIKSSLLLSCLAISILFVTWGCVIRTHYLIPKKKDKIFVFSSCLGAIVNLICNVFLIPNLASVGVAISAILTEFSVILFQTFHIRKELEIVNYFKVIGNIAIKTFIMVIIVNLFNFIRFDNLILKLFIQVLMGIIIYACLNIKYLQYILSDFIFINRNKNIK